MNNRLNNPQYLIGYWRLNSVPDDYSGQGNDGTWTGESYVDSPYDSMVGEFDGTDDKVAIGNVYNGVKSVAFLVKAGSTSEQFLELNGSANITVSTGTVTATGWTSPTIYVNGDISSTITANDWYFIVVTSATGINASAVNLGVEGSNFGDIDMGEVRFYNEVLTGDEVKQLYEQTQRPPKHIAPSVPLDVLPDQTDTKLKGAWLNKAVTNTGDDYSSNQNDASTVSGVKFKKTGAEYTDNDEYVEVTAASSINLGDTAQTISAWIKLDSHSGTAYIYSTRDSSKGALSMTVSDTGDFFSLIGTTSQTSATTDYLLDNQWHYLVLGYSDDVIYYYIDGSFIQIRDVIGSPSWDVTVNKRIGTRVGGSGFSPNGIVKDVRVYSELKSADWISQEYKKSVPEDDLVLWLTDGTEDKSKNNQAITNTNVKVGKDMVFDGASGELLLVSNELNTIFSGGGTISFTFNPESDGEGNGGRIFQGNNSMYTISEASGEINLQFEHEFSGDNGRWNFSSGKVKLNQKSRIVVIYDNSNLTNNPVIYINGVSQTLTEATTPTGTAIDSGTNYRIGNRNGDDRTFDGSIQEVKVYNTEKSADWVKKDYEKAKRFF